MSGNNNRWHVDTRTRSRVGTAFDMTMLLLTDAKPGYLKFDPCDRKDLRDFISELVHEIERLQTENIRLFDNVIWLQDKFADRLNADSANYISP